MTYKSYVGADSVYYALITQDDADAYAAGTPAYLAPIMNIAQAPATNSAVQYADDQPFDAMSSEGETKLDLEITGLPLDKQATLLGRVYDAVNDELYDNGGTAPYVAIGFRSKKSDGNYRYYWFLKGTFSSPSEEQATQSDSPDPKSMKLEFTAIRTTYQFDLDGGTTYDGVKRVIADDEDSAITAATWFGSVNVPSAGSPSAFTCTPSPTDGASGQAVDVAITLTFSNPVSGGCEEGVVLLDADAYTIFTTTKSWNAARTVLTLAHANLSTSTTYNIIVAGVMSIYGQDLADVAYDFTTTA